jgi:hypothetical protein
MLAVMLSKLTSASAPTATLAAIFSIFANRIMLLFVSFLPKMCPQLLKARSLACSWLAIPLFSPCGRVDAAVMWFGTLVKSKYTAPRTLLLLRRVATEGPNSNPVICSGLGQH